MFRFLKFVLLLSTFVACGQNKMEPPKDAAMKFEKFIQKEKFVAEGFYPGIMDEKMLPILTKNIHLAAQDFKKISENETPTEDQYQQAIAQGLSRFDKMYLDTEDRERVCSYFEELMDIVELESSGGLLNDFMYGFNPE